MFEFDIIQCGLIVLCLMVAGEVIAHKLKAIVPSILASSVLFLLLVWCKIIPSDLVSTSGLTHLTAISMMFVVTGMGASTNPEELLDNWRVVALAAISYIGQTCFILLIVSFFFDRNTAIGSLPGSAAVSLIVQERARELGHDHIIVLSVLLIAVQGLVACPIASWMIRKEIRNMRKAGTLSSGTVLSENCDLAVKRDQAGKHGHSDKHNRTVIKHDLSGKFNIEKSESFLHLITKWFPHKNTASHSDQSPYWSLLRLYIVSWLASRLELYTGISRYVLCLILGVLFAQLGFLPKDEIARSKSQGLLNLMMMTMLLNGFAGATPQLFLELLAPLGCILLTDILSILLLTMIFGKLFHFSKPMAFAIGLNVMIGFPLNLMLAQDIIEFLAETPQEKELLTQQISNKMVIAGFTSVTFLSTVGAGLLVKFMC